MDLNEFYLIMPDIITMNPPSFSSPTSSATYVDNSPRKNTNYKVQYHMNWWSTYTSSDGEAEDLRQHFMSPGTENKFDVPATSFISHVCFLSMYFGIH
jgi:hypothetical protein